MYDEPDPALRMSDPHLQRSLTAAKIGVWEYDPDRRAAKADAQTASLFGLSNEDVLWSPIEEFQRAIHVDDAAEVLARLQSREPFEAMFRTAVAEDGERWLRAVGCWSKTGGRTRLHGVTFDVTRERARSDELELMIGEMRHRIGNAFSIIAGLVTLEAARADTPRALAAAVRDRMTTLAQAQALSLGDDLLHGGLSLEQLIQKVAEPFVERTEGRLTLSGPAVALSDEARSSLGLVIYEWLTNALKYGALSTVGGRIDVRWRRDGGDFFIDWRETGGPKVETPASDGFGQKLQIAALRRIRGEALREWADAGLIIHVSASSRFFTVGPATGPATR